MTAELGVWLKVPELESNRKDPDRDLSHSRNYQQSLEWWSTELLALLSPLEQYQGLLVHSMLHSGRGWKWEIWHGQQSWYSSWFWVKIGLPSTKEIQDGWSKIDKKERSMLWVMGYMCIYHFRDGERKRKKMFNWVTTDAKKVKVKKGGRIPQEWSGYPNRGPYRELLLFWKNTGCSMKKERTRSWIYAQT